MTLNHILDGFSLVGKYRFSSATSDSDVGALAGPGPSRARDSEGGPWEAAARAASGGLGCSVAVHANHRFVQSPAYLAARHEGRLTVEKFGTAQRYDSWAQWAQASV